MERKGLLVLGAVTFSALVLAFAVTTWIGTESRLLGAAEAEGRALLRSVAAGIESSLEASRAVEKLLEERLVRLAPVLERQLAEHPGQENETLRAFCAAHGLRGAIHLNGDLEVRAAAGPSRPGGMPTGDPRFARRIDRIENEELARRAREAGLGSANLVVFGFGENLFRPRNEFSIGARAPRLRGFLILRLDARPVDAFLATAGVEPLLAAAAEAEAIDHLVIVGDDGTVLAADDPARKDEAYAVSSESAWRETPSGRRVIDVALPAPWKGDPAGTIHVGLAAEPVEAVQRRARLGLGVTTVLVLLVGNGALFYLAHRVRRMRREEARLRAALETRERFAALGRLAAGIAHEIRSPLNALSMAAQRLRREAVPEEPGRREAFDSLGGTIRTSVERLDHTVAEFLTLGRPAAPPQRANVDLAGLVGEVVAGEYPDAVLEPPGEPVALRADPELLRKALSNLVRNARQAAPEGTVRIGWEGDGDSVRIEVRDDGPGIPEDEREAVFEPFRTGRAGGTGLGLAIARDAVVSQGGEIEVGEGPGGIGARFLIRLPDRPLEVRGSCESG